MRQAKKQMRQAKNPDQIGKKTDEIGKKNRSEWAKKPDQNWQKISE